MVNSRGREGDEIEDFIEEEQITTSKPRRRSNSNSHVTNGNVAGVSGAVKSKFEVNDIDEEAVEEWPSPLPSCRDHGMYLVDESPGVAGQWSLWM